MKFLAAIFSLQISTVLAVGSLVNLSYTAYNGVELQNGVSQWLGMRYAAPPLGELRFRAPIDPIRNDTTQLADEHGPICLATGEAFPTPGTAEDCLFIDVYAPSNAKTSSRLPVYFFIQGGGFNEDGTANCNGSGLIIASDMNIVVVNFNYRVGAFGFLASEEIQRNGNLNVGLLDQLKALEWVQQHISQFGGNPDHVVLGGDSAGAGSIALLLVAYGGKDLGLYHGAIAESPFLPVQLTVEQSQFQYNTVVKLAGCQNASDTLACLRSVNIETLQNSNVLMPYPGRTNNALSTFTPVQDGILLEDSPFQLFSEGKFVKVPSIFGDTTNEGTIFAPVNASTSQQMTSFISDQYPYVSECVLEDLVELYPESTPVPGHGAYFSAASNAYGEITLICPGLFISEQINLFMPGKSFNYRYNVIDPALAALGLGVLHTGELPAVWGSAAALNAGDEFASYSTINAPIIPVVQGYWTSFIRTLNPNVYMAPGSPKWTPFTSSMERILLQTNATTLETVPEDQRERCSFLTSKAAGEFHQ